MLACPSNIITAKPNSVFDRSLDGKQFILSIEQMSDDISYMKVIDIIIKLKFMGFTEKQQRQIK